MINEVNSPADLLCFILSLFSISFVLWSLYDVLSFILIKKNNKNKTKDDLPSKQSNTLTREKELKQRIENKKNEIDKLSKEISEFLSNAEQFKKQINQLKKNIKDVKELIRTSPENKNESRTTHLNQTLETLKQELEFELAEYENFKQQLIFFEKILYLNENELARYKRELTKLHMANDSERVTKIITEKNLLDDFHSELSDKNQQTFTQLKEQQDNFFDRLTAAKQLDMELTK